MTDSVDKQAIYAGQREVMGGKLAHVWVVDEKEMLFSKPTGGVVGGIYILKMTPNLEQVFSAPARYTMERIADGNRIAVWEVEHQTIVRKRRRAAAERKHKANGVLGDATWRLDRIVESMRGVDEVYALSEVLKEHLLETYWKSRK